MPAMCLYVDEKLLFGNGSSVCDSLVVSVIVLRAFSIVCSERLLVGSFVKEGPVLWPFFPCTDVFGSHASIMRANDSAVLPMITIFAEFSLSACLFLALLRAACAASTSPPPLSLSLSAKPRRSMCFLFYGCLHSVHKIAGELFRNPLTSQTLQSVFMPYNLITLSDCLRSI